MATSDGGGEDFFGYMPDMGGSAPSMPSTLGGGDASQATTVGNGDPYGRKNQWGLLGLYGDNGNLSSSYGSGVGLGGLQQQQQQPNDGYGWNTIDPNISLTQTADSDPSAGMHSLLGIGFDSSFLNQLGYSGADPMSFRQGSGDAMSVGVDPAFVKFLQDQNVSLGRRAIPGYNQLQATDSGGNQKAFSQWADEPDNGFGLAMMLAGGAAGAAIGGGAVGAGYGEGVAGAASDAGSLGAGATGATAADVGTVAPSWATAAGQGAGGGFGSTMVRSGGDVGQSLKAGAIGGITGGVTQGLNPASYAGIDDPTYARGFNNAATAGGRAALTGGNIGSSVLGSLQTSALGAGLNYGANALGGNGMPDTSDYSNEGRNYGTPNIDPGMNTFAGTMGNYSTPVGGFGGYFSQAPDMSNVSPAYQGPSGGNIQPSPMGGMDTGQGVNTGQQTKRQANPVLDFAKTALSGFSGNGAGGKPGNFDGLAGNLMQLWQSRKNAGQYGQLANNLSSLYSPNSPYAQQLQQTLMRSDAASGRRSQVGPRSVELQARLADLNSRNAPELARLYASQQNNQGQQLQSLLRMGQNPMIQNGLSNLWNRYGEGGEQPPSPFATANQNPDWAPGD